MQYDSVYMRRLRVRLNQNEASTIATALIGGTLAPEPAGWSEHARLLAHNINLQWARHDYAKFPQPIPGDGTTRAIDNLGSLLTGNGPYYADYFTLHYVSHRHHHEDTVHAHVCLWDNVSTQDTFAFRTGADIESLWTSTRSRGVSQPPSPFNNSISDVELVNVLLDPRAVAPEETRPFIPSRLAYVFDVDTLSGPALTDPVWLRAFPDEGTDITFDANYTDGVSARYRLSRPSTTK